MRLVDGIMNDCAGRALRGPSRCSVVGNLTLDEVCVLLLRDRLDPSWLSFCCTTLVGSRGKLTIGENDLGVDGEKDDTCKSMANSSVAFVSPTMPLRNTDGTSCASLYILTALDSWTTAFYDHKPL